METNENNELLTKRRIKMKIQRPNDVTNKQKAMHTKKKKQKRTKKTRHTIGLLVWLYFFFCLVNQQNIWIANWFG